MGFCGGDVSKQEKDAQATQAALTNTLMQQAQQIMGDSSKVFAQMFASFAPIVAAGPFQEGYSEKEKALQSSEVVTQTGIAARNAMTAVKEAGAAYGGGNVALPGGARIGAETGTANIAAQTSAAELENIETRSLALGRQNFFQAAGVLGGAPQVFNPATAAGQAATGAAAGSAQTAEDITKVQNQPGWGMGLLSAAGALGGSFVSGGMSNMGKSGSWWG
jgi:hypothetical protein